MPGFELLGAPAGSNPEGASALGPTEGDCEADMSGLACTTEELVKESTGAGSSTGKAEALVSRAGGDAVCESPTAGGEEGDNAGPAYGSSDRENETDDTELVGPDGGGADAGAGVGSGDGMGKGNSAASDCSGGGVDGDTAGAGAGDGPSDTAGGPIGTLGGEDKAGPGAVSDDDAGCGGDATVGSGAGARSDDVTEPDDSSVVGSGAADDSGRGSGAGEASFVGVGSTDVLGGGTGTGGVSGTTGGELVVVGLSEIGPTDDGSG